jgi:hypothetical protein
MTASAEPQILAEVGGVAVAEWGPLVVVVDRARRLYVDADGVVVAPLEQVRFQSRTQLTSSSPMLVAVTPDGVRTLKRGNPFNGGLGNLEAVLTAACSPRCDSALGRGQARRDSTSATTASAATSICSPVARFLTPTVPASTSRSPATSAIAAPDRSAARMAPLRPRSP